MESTFDKMVMLSATLVIISQQISQIIMHVYVIWITPLLNDACKTYGCFGSERVLKPVDTSWLCITGLVSALGQYSNGLGQIMKSPSVRTLTYYYIAQMNSRNALPTGL